MKISTESLLGRLTLMFGHVAGMLDLVVVPLWIGGLMETYKLQPQQAGATVTLFLIGILLTNAFIARLFGRVSTRATVVAGYTLGGLSFLAMTRAPFGLFGSPIVELGLLHLLAGLGVGAGLGCVHGTIAQTGNPHRTFAIVNFGMGLFGIAFFAGVPPIMAKIGVSAVFYGIAGLMAAAVALSLFAFPTPPTAEARAAASPASSGSSKMGAAIVLGFAGVILMQIGQGVSNAFVERVGNFRGFSAEAIGIMLAINGVVALSPPILAGLLQKRIPALTAAVGALVLHGLASIMIFNTTAFPLYSIAFMTMIFMAIFGHTFIFGLFAKFDPSGRMNASTPFMLMTGAAIGPFLGGTLVQFNGYPMAGIVAGAITIAGAGCFAAIAWMQRTAVATAPVSA